MGMYFLGINLRTYPPLGSFGDCGAEFSWEPSEVGIAFSTDSEGREVCQPQKTRT